MDPFAILEAFKELFSFVFTEKCRIDGEEISPEEAETLHGLSHEEIFDNFKEIIGNLLKFRKG